MVRKRTWLMLGLFLGIMVLDSAYSQYDYVGFNTSNFNEPDIIFGNPAGISFRKNSQLIIGNQFLYMGLSDDQLYNFYSGFIQPIKGFGVLGFRGGLFNSYTLQQGSLSLLYSHLFFGGWFSLGVNANLHFYSYNKDKFEGVDLNDPIIIEGLSKNAFGLGISAICKPISNLSFGLSLDDLNQPDISIGNYDIRKPLLTRIGISYRISGIIPQFDILNIRNAQRSETYYNFNVKKFFFDNNAFLSANYNMESVSFGAGIYWRDFRIDCNYDYLLNEIGKISNGSLQFTIVYNFIPKPSISLISPDSSPQFVNTRDINIKATTKNTNKVEIVVNSEKVDTRLFPKTNKTVNIDQSLNLKEGDNTIELIAYNDKKRSSKKITINYQPEKVVTTGPKIRFLGIDDTVFPDSAIIKDSVFKVKILIENVWNIKNIFIKRGDEEITTKGGITSSVKKNGIEIDIALHLRKGPNDFDIIAFDNKGESASKRLFRFYDTIKTPLYNVLWAVIIGINKYKDPSISTLNYALNDAKAIEEILREKFKFDHVIPLYNEKATKINIIKTLSTNLREAKREDGIFVFFSGHGCTEQTSKGSLGYIVPYDGSYGEKELYEKNISMKEIREIITPRLKAKHIFYVVDCCYSGLLLEKGKSAEVKKIIDSKYIENVSKKEALQFLTGGGKGEAYLEHGRWELSIFADCLIKALKGVADKDKNYITAMEIGALLPGEVYKESLIRGSPHTPQYRKWEGEGDFIFIMK